MKFQLFVAGYLFFSTLCFGNVGIFGGYGQNVQLQKAEKIQMVSETINISEPVKLTIMQIA
jgi:hypothetical protein